MQEWIVSLPIPPCFPPTPSRIPKKILFQGFLRVEARSPLTNLPWYADRLLRVIIVCFVTSYTHRPLRRKPGPGPYTVRGSVLVSLSPHVKSEWLCLLNEAHVRTLSGEVFSCRCLPTLSLSDSACWMKPRSVHCRGKCSRVTVCPR